MGECKSEHCCQSEEPCEAESSSCCGESEHESECCSMVEGFLDIAKVAKHELLKEKMKKVLEAKMGTKMDKVAEVVVSSALACMQNKMAEREAFKHLEEALTAIFKS